LAAGLACEGQKPVVAIYSTFLQRAYDQLIHDVALQNLDVTFAIDRAGLVGEDGPTHAGSFDLSFLRCVPNMLVAVPSDENECHQLLNGAFNHSGPAAVRYPRGAGTGAVVNTLDEQLPPGKGREVLHGNTVCILNFGVLLPAAREIAERHGWTLCDMRWAKPLDEALILAQAPRHELVVTLEENSVAGGAGSAVGEFLQSQALVKPMLQLGLPDLYFEHGQRAELLDQAGLSMERIESRILLQMQKLGLKSEMAANH
jgi:1-deoxy-D-xylulose-5-phosphate synthase